MQKTQQGLLKQLMNIIYLTEDKKVMRIKNVECAYYRDIQHAE